jgi:hypothetical protein
VQPFSGAPEAAAALLLAAGIALIGSVQAAITLRKHTTTPSELEEWYPEYFREAVDGPTEADDQFEDDGRPVVMGSFIESTGGWSYRQVGRRSYGAQVRERLYSETLKANRWAAWARRLYHAGVVALLAGLTALVWPPAGDWQTWRYVLVGLAGSATVAECIWIQLVSTHWWRSSPRSRGGHRSAWVLGFVGWSLGLASLINPDDMPFAALAMVGGAVLIVAGVVLAPAADKSRRRRLTSVIGAALVTTGALWLVFGLSFASG